MRREGHIIEEIVAYPNMAQSFDQVLRGTARKRSRQGRYLLTHREDVIKELSQQIANGNKISYAVVVPADRDNVSERKVYSLIKRYKSDCNSLIFFLGGGGIFIRRINRTLTRFICGARALQ